MVGRKEVQEFGVSPPRQLIEWDAQPASAWEVLLSFNTF